MPTASTGVGREGSALAPLQHVANRPIVCHVLEQLRQADVEQIALVAPRWAIDELKSVVESAGPADLEVVYAAYGGDGGQEHALRIVTELVGDEPCVIHAADGMLTEPLAGLLARHPADRDMVAYVHRAHDGSTALATRRLLKLVEYPSHEEHPELGPGDGSLELAGICLFGLGALRRVSEQHWCKGENLDLATIAERFVHAGARLSIEAAGGWLQYSGSTTELLALNRFLLDGLVGDELDVTDGSNRLEGCVVVHPTASVQSSTIVGPAIIGPEALVLGAYIGPYTSIGACSHIEGAEVERSIILAGARITHIGGRLVGSVVGRDARIFRDFSLPRAMRLNVGDGGEVALC